MRNKATAALLALIMVFVGCSTSWVQQAIAIVNVLTPAAVNILSLVSLLNGKTITPSEAQLIQTWSSQTTTDLTLIGSLINQYDSATVADKPGILAKISTGIEVAQKNTADLLTALHISDPATQAKVNAVIGLVAAEFSSLAAIIQIAGGPSHPSTQQKRLAAQVMSAKQFKSAFNNVMAAPSGNSDVDAAASKLGI